MPFEDLMTNPLAAVGYGLLTSRQNPLGSAYDMLLKGEEIKRQREDSDFDRQYKAATLGVQQQRLQMPDLQFNPVTGEMVDMRTGTPYSGGATPSGNSMQSNGGLSPALTKFAEQERIRAQYQADANTAAEQRRQEAEARKAEQKLKEEREKAQVFGYDLAPDVLPTTTNVSGAQDLAATLGAYDNAVKGVKDVISAEGSTIGWGTDVNKADQALNNLLQMERKLNETGVLNMGELPTLEQTYATFNPKLKTNLFTTREDMQKAADDYLLKRKGLINDKLKGYGYTPKKQAQTNEQDKIALRIAEIEALLSGGE